ncbi:MAG: TrkA C-terminal domain-containing protein, partial [Nocardioidaceae bacterium]
LSVIVQGGLLPEVARRLGLRTRVVNPEPFALSVRFSQEPDAVRRFVVAAGASVEGSTIGELPIGENFWISLVIRSGRLVTVSADTRLEVGDEVVALVDTEADDDLGSLFGAASRSNDQPAGPGQGPVGWLQRRRGSAPDNGTPDAPGPEP